MRFPRVSVLVVALALLSANIGAVQAQDATPSAGDSLLAGFGYPELVLSATDEGFADPGEVAAGLTLITFENNGTMEADLELYAVGDSAGYQALLDAVAAADPESGEVPEFFYETTISGGVGALPGETGQVVVDLVPGTYAFNYFAFDEEAGTDLNLPIEVEVTGEATGATPPEADVVVDMFEMDFTMPDEVAAGPLVWEVTTVGAQPHFMLLSRYPEEFTEEDVMELLATFGPPASPAAGSPAAATPEPALDFALVEDVFDSGVLSTGQTNWVEIDLEPGYYVALCFITDPETGAPHAMRGMIELFEVV